MKVAEFVIGRPAGETKCVGRVVAVKEDSVRVRWYINGAITSHAPEQLQVVCVECAHREQFHGFGEEQVARQKRECSVCS